MCGGRRWGQTLAVARTWSSPRSAHTKHSLRHHPRPAPTPQPPAPRLYAAWCRPAAGRSSQGGGRARRRGAARLQGQVRSQRCCLLRHGCITRGTSLDCTCMAVGEGEGIAFPTGCRPCPTPLLLMPPAGCRGALPRATALLRAKDSELAEARASGGSGSTAGAAAELEAARQLMGEVCRARRGVCVLCVGWVVGPRGEGRVSRKRFWSRRRALRRTALRCV